MNTIRWILLAAGLTIISCGGEHPNEREEIAELQPFGSKKQCDQIKTEKNCLADSNCAWEADPICSAIASYPPVPCKPHCYTLSTKTCSDGTPQGQCTTTSPTFCDTSGHLIEDCVQCPSCPGDQTCVTSTRKCSGSGKTGVSYRIGSDGDYLTWDAFRNAVGTPAVGADVLFKRGETFTMNSTRKSIVIDWSGTADDWVNIGAYGAGADPILDGEWLFPQGFVCDPTNINHCWGAIVQCKDAQYVRMEHLDIRNAMGVGVTIRHASHVRLVDSRINRTWGAAFLGGEVNDGVVEGCDIGDMTLVKKLAGPKSNRGGGAVFSHSDNVKFTRNYLHDGHHEGFGIYLGVTNAEVSFNRVEAIAAVGIYIGRANHVVVKHNLVVYPKNPLVPPKDYAKGIGMVEEGRDRPTTGMLHDVLTYGNVIVGMPGTGIHLAPAHPDAPPMHNMHIINNSVIDCGYGIKLNNMYDASMTGGVVRGNIFWFRKAAVDGNIDKALSKGVEFQGNQWNAMPGAQVRHAKDVYALPSLNMPGGGYLQYDYKEFKISMAAQKPGSSGIDSGLDNSAYFSELLAPSSTDPQTATLSTVTQWDFGAIDY